MYGNYFAWKRFLLLSFDSKYNCTKAFENRWPFEKILEIRLIAYHPTTIERKKKHQQQHMD